MHPQARESIRSARRTSGLSLRELGRRTGVTASLLSQIENGKADPSLSTLAALVAELDLSLDAVLRATGGDRPGGPVGEGGPPGDASPVVRPDERDARRLESGVLHERLPADRAGPRAALLVTFPPVADPPPDRKILQHNGFESAYLVRGELLLELDGHPHRVAAGDWLHFDAAVPHRYRNAGAEPAQGLWLNPCRA